MPETVYPEDRVAYVVTPCHGEVQSRVLVMDHVRLRHKDVTEDVYDPGGVYGGSPVDVLYVGTQYRLLGQRPETPPRLTQAEELALAVLGGEHAAARILADEVLMTGPDGKLPDRLTLHGQLWLRGPCGHLHPANQAWAGGPTPRCCHRDRDGRYATEENDYGDGIGVAIRCAACGFTVASTAPGEIPAIHE